MQRIGSYNTAIVTSLIALATLTTTFGIGASCVPFDIAGFFQESQAVFVGRVMGTKAVRTGAEWNEVHTVATLRVQRLWKGPDSPVIEVTTCGSVPDNVLCTVGADFKVGTTYLVTAYGEPLSTSKCGTRPIDESIDELLWLAAKPSRRIYEGSAPSVMYTDIRRVLKLQPQ